MSLYQGRPDIYKLLESLAHLVLCQVQTPQPQVATLLLHKAVHKVSCPGVLDEVTPQVQLLKLRVLREYSICKGDTPLIIYVVIHQSQILQIHGWVFDEQSHLLNPVVLHVVVRQTNDLQSLAPGQALEHHLIVIMMKEEPMQLKHLQVRLRA